MRNDKKLRAKRMGSSSLLFLSTQFDKFLNQEFKKEQMEALPLSIKGFRLVPEEGVEPSHP